MNRYIILNEEVATPKNFNLQKEYDKYNHLLFSGKLPRIPLKWDKNKNRGGAVSYFGFRNKPESWEIRYLSLSNYMERQIEDVIPTLIHEMIHVYIIHNKIKDKSHGPVFKSMARALGKQVGMEIPITSDITNMSVSSSIKTKTFFMVVFHRGNSVYGVQLWNLDKMNTVKDVYQSTQSFLNYMKSNKMWWEYYTSKDRALLKLKVNRVVTVKTLNALRVEDEELKRILSNSKKVGEFKPE